MRFDEFQVNEREKLKEKKQNVKQRVKKMKPKQ